MKTLADLKREIRIGDKIECFYFNWAGEKSNLVPEKMQGVRTVIKKNTVGLVLNSNPNAKTGSYFDYPLASEVTIHGNFITVEPVDDKGKVYQTRKYKVIT